MQPSFKEKQRKIVEAASKERKEAEEERRKQNERDYWADVRDQEDSHYNRWDLEPAEKDEDARG